MFGSHQGSRLAVKKAHQCASAFPWLCGHALLPRSIGGCLWRKMVTTYPWKDPPLTEMAHPACNAIVDP